MSSITEQDFETGGSAPSSLYSNVEVPRYHEEHVVSSTDYVKNVFKNPKERTVNYVRGIFPFLEWFPHYPTNLNWILSDFITGVTVAIVLVPQSMSYAKLAGLEPQFGLYSAFIGLVFYFIFATSREICIGPVAVLSTEVGKIVSRVQAKYGDEYSANEIATTLALICGGIVLGIGLLRLAFIVELLSLPAILAFTTGSAFNIVCGQLAGLMGFKNKVGKKTSTYEILIEFLKHLPDTKVDAAFGLVDLFILYAWQYIVQHFINKNKNNPKRRLALIYLLNLRTAFVIIISTCISFGVLRNHKGSKTPYSIIGNIPSGLNHVGRFIPNSKLVSRLATDLPICSIVLVLEHISISKSFARLNGYRVNPNQEFIAIGFTNMIGTFFGAYPVTGSFSRTALSAQCGVKTPFKAAFSGGCVLLAIYCFTSGFYYIPNATLCAIIIHCVTGLLVSYKITTRLYMFSPVDFIIFIVGVLITVFASIEDGIYWALCASCAQLLWRSLIPNGAFLGRVKVTTVRNPVLTSNSDSSFISEQDENSDFSVLENECIKKCLNAEQTKVVQNRRSFVYKWVPLPKDELNPSFVHTRYANNTINVEKPPRGVLVYRMSESFIYTNSSMQIDQIIGKVCETFKQHDSDRERLWCEYSIKEKNWKFPRFNVNSIFKRSVPESDELEIPEYEDNKETPKGRFEEGKPKLKILHLDFSQVVAVDATSIQCLLDLKTTIDNFCGAGWEFHFSGIINPWVIRALINAGFGRKSAETAELENQYLKKQFHKLPLFNKNNGSDDFENDQCQIDNSELEVENVEYNQENIFPGDLEVAIDDTGNLFSVHSTEYPNFHLDVPSYSEYE